MRTQQNLTFGTASERVASRRTCHNKRGDKCINMHERLATDVGYLTHTPLDCRDYCRQAGCVMSGSMLTPCARLRTKLARVNFVAKLALPICRRSWHDLTSRANSWHVPTWGRSWHDLRMQRLSRAELESSYRVASANFGAKLAVTI